MSDIQDISHENPYACVHISKFIGYPSCHANSKPPPWQLIEPACFS